MYMKLVQRFVYLLSEVGNNNKLFHDWRLIPSRLHAEKLPKGMMGREKMIEED